MDRVEYQPLIVQDLVNLEKAGELNLRPWYQRRSTWSSTQQSYLINTLFERKPIPALYVRHSLDLDKGKSIREVVDGQQRSRSIIDYCAGKFSARHPDHVKKVKFTELTKPERERFLLTALPAGNLLGASDADVIDIFARINSVAKTLNAQEKRNALYSGEFKQFAVNEAVRRTEFWRQNEIFSDTEISRMAEVQFISDLTLNLLNGLSDFTPARLNALYERYDEEFVEAEKTKNRIDRVFSLLADLDADTLSSTIFSRQPIFFSLFIVLDSTSSLTSKKISKGILEIDNRFYDETDQMAVEFVKASSASTQRIAQRRVRDKYIRKFIK